MIKEFVKQSRQKADLSMAQLAEKVGCRTATISDFENGKYNIGSDKLESIFDILKIKMIELKK